MAKKIVPSHEIERCACQIQDSSFLQTQYSYEIVYCGQGRNLSVICVGIYSYVRVLADEFLLKSLAWNISPITPSQLSF